MSTTAVHRGDYWRNKADSRTLVIVTPCSGMHGNDYVDVELITDDTGGEPPAGVWAIRLGELLTDWKPIAAEATPTGRSLADDLERLAATSPDVRRADARARARFQRLAGCTCTSLDDGRIYLDAACKVHGREARPENWS